MPKKDGLDFLEELRREGNRTPFIFLTGNDTRENAIKALNLGANGYLIKSCNPEATYAELANRITRVTKAEQKQKSVKENEHKYLTLFAKMLNGFAYCKMIFNENEQPIDFVYLEINDAFEKITGLKKENIIGKQVTKAIPHTETDHPELINLYGKVALNGQEERIEIFFNPLSIWLHISVYSPEKGYFVAIFEDITKRKTLEAALIRSEERYRVITDSLPEIIFEMDNRGKLTYVNKKGFELTGYNQEDFEKGVFNLEFFAPEDKERAKEDFAQVMMTTTNYEYTLVRKDGGKIPVIVKSIPIKSEGKTVGLRGIILDLTERKKTLEQLVFHAKLLDTAEQAIVMTDKEGAIRYWNNGAKKLYGCPAEAAIGHKLDEISSATLSIMEEGEGNNLVVTRESSSREIKAKRADGSDIWLILNSSPIVNEAGQFVGSINISTDISDQKWMEKELVGYAEAFSESSKRIQELNDKLRVVGNLTRHDIRNKLAALNAYTYLLKRKIENPDALQYIAEMENTSKQMIKILDFEHAYEQVGSEELVFVDVEKFFSEASALISDFKGIQISSECKGLNVLADSLLRQLLYNLMDNTLKYGEKTSKIRLHYENEPNQLRLIYEDNGVGIPQELKGHLFEKGFGRGTGFGLYMMKRICETYGWSMFENGKFKEGAKFIIIIPKDRFTLKTTIN